MALIQTLRDPFNDDSFNNDLWGEVEGGSATVTEQNKRIELALPASATSSSDAEIISDGTFDLTASYAVIHLLEAVNPATNALMIFRIYTDSDNWFQFIQEAGTLYFQRRKAATSGTVASVAFALATHTWWRIRETGGDVKWDTSTDGKAWTERASYTHGMTITAMKALIQATCYQNETSPGNFIVRDFNVFPVKDVVGSGFVPAGRP